MLFNPAQMRASNLSNRRGTKDVAVHLIHAEGMLKVRVRQAVRKTAHTHGVYVAVCMYDKLCAGLVGTRLVLLILRARLAAMRSCK